jgi:lipoprotein-releasing system ATP-binding protein
MNEPARVDLPADRSSPLLSVRSLSKTYLTAHDSVEVLSGVDLTVAGSAIVAVTGESGCGKSTLLNLIGGLDRPSAGSVRIDGEDIVSLPESAMAAYRNRCIGFIFQFHFLLKDFTALENVILPGMLSGRSREETALRGRALLDEVGLAPRASHFPAELSGGERQRVAVARALMNEPRLILADEPTGNLDERNARAVQDLLFGLVEKHGRTLILVTHDRALAAQAERRYVLHGGSLREE